MNRTPHGHASLAKKVHRHLHLEALEERCLLDGTGFGALEIDTSLFDSEHILVRFRPELASADYSTEAILPGARLARELGVPGLHKVALDSGTSVEEALAAFRSSPLVAYAEPNYLIRAAATPNDPSFGQLWGLNNTGQTGGTADADIDAIEAWDLHTGSGNTIVAVIDTGVDYLHPDLAGNMWVNTGEIADNGIDDDGNGYVDDIHGYDFVNEDGDPMDDHNHGTHVAGTIGAVGNDNVGIAGINWDVQIMALKFLAANGSGSIADAIEAIDYAVDNGATISNNSWGFNGGFSQPLYDTIANAGDEDHIFVAAAGNGNMFGIGQDNDLNPFYPANFTLDNVVVVAATDHNDNRAVFSNFGQTSVDLAAPGVNILSTTRNNTYTAFNGTSMATPHVAGVIALVRDKYPTWNTAQVISHVYASVDHIPAMQGISTTGGRLNAHLAVQPPPVNDLNWTGGSLTAPTTTTTEDLFTVQRTYNVSGEPIVEDFVISYYGSIDTTFGNADDFFLGSESITDSADKSVGTHSGTSPGLKIPILGNVHVFSRLDSGGNVRENSELNNVLQAGNSTLVTGSMIIDDGDSGYTETNSGWSGWINGYNSDHRFTAAGNGNRYATWEFGNLEVGNYQIQASWLAETNRATDAPYRIYDDDTLRATVRIDQQQIPVGTTVNGTPFQSLIDLPIYSGTLRIELANDANNYVIADAVRLSTLPPPAIDLELTDSNFTAPTTASTDSAFTVNRTYTISGEAASADFRISYFASRDTTFGNADDFLIGSETITDSGDKAIGTHSGSTSIQIHTGGTFHIYAQIDENRDILETDETNNVALAAQPIVVSGPIIIDDGDPGYSEVGAGWQGWIAGWNNDHRYNSAGTGSSKAIWEFTGLAQGSYEVQATWLAFSNRATNAPYRIYDGGSLLETVRVNQQLVASGTTINGFGFQTLATFEDITSGTLRVELADDANNFVIGDAVRLVALPPRVSDVSWQNGGITANSSSTESSFTVDRTYTITGEPAPSDFTISYYVSRDTMFGNGDDVLLGTETITDASDKTAGTHSGTSPSFQLPLLGNVYVFAQLDSADEIREIDESNNVVHTADPIEVTGSVIMDDGDSGYSEVGSGWFGASGGHDGDHRFNAAGNGSAKATWEFTDLLAGNYEVQATWFAFSNRASNAPYRIYDGTTLVTTVLVDQRANPTGENVNGHDFQSLASVYISSGTLRIELADDADNYVIPDAVRVKSPNLDIDWTGGGITAPGSASTESTFTVNRTYSITGEAVSDDFTIAYYASRDAIFGNADDFLVGSETVTDSGDKSVGSHSATSPALHIDRLGTFHLFAHIDSANAVLEISETNNHVQAAQTIAVSGSEIKDDGDVGYSESGSNWFGWVNGFGNDHRFNAAGTGSNKATWEFDGLDAGYYEIHAAWLAETNRATNAPYRIYDGTTLLDTIRVDQRQIPNGPSANGHPFQLLTTVPVSGTLRIELANDADNYVIADAVRIVSVATPTIDLNWSGGSLIGPTTVAEGTGFTVSRAYSIVGEAASDDFTIAYYASRDGVVGNGDDILLGSETITDSGDKSVGTHSGTSPTLQISNLGSFQLFAVLDDGRAILETSESNNGLTTASPILITGDDIIDDGDSAYSEIGSGWFGASGGYGNDHRFNAAGNGSNKAVWEFTDLGNGDFTVSATWFEFSNRATDAPYRIYDGGTLLGTVRIDQRNAPVGPTIGGEPFQELATVTLTSGVLRVELANDADNYVIPDAVRIEAVTPSPAIAFALVESTDTTPSRSLDLEARVIPVEGATVSRIDSPRKSAALTSSFVGLERHRLTETVALTENESELVSEAILARMLATDDGFRSSRASRDDIDESTTEAAVSDLDGVARIDDSEERTEIAVGAGLRAGTGWDWFDISDINLVDVVFALEDENRLEW